MAANTPARSEETEVAVDACLGDGVNVWQGVSRTFELLHAAVGSPGFFTGAAHTDRPFLFVSCKAFHCESANNGSSARLLPFASLQCRLH